MKYFFIFTLLLVSVFSRLDRHFFKSNDSFCPKYILPNWSRLPQYETKNIAIDEITNQPFSYLTKGKQSFVFVSRDQKWVLKFPRLPRRMMRLAWTRPAPNAFFENFIQNGKWIYEELGKETGILYAHLKPTTHLGSIHLIDRFQQHYFLALDELPFFIQKYGENYFSYFEKQQNPKPLIEKTVQLFSDLYEKGFIDRDPILDKNFGVLIDSPFIMDIGQLEKCAQLPPRNEYLQQMTQSLEGKLSQESPELLSFYKNLLQ
ncbi:MAG: hypothetical protein KR126chlam3_01228 [Chlamydiae bacterium]|nr:hypothetical protein [Chlamydiota bacterium]